MENSIIRSIRQIEEECEELKTKAYVDKNNIIENAEDTVRKMELDFQNLKQENRKKTLEETKLRNEEVLESETANARAEISKIQSIVREKEQGAISLIMSLIVGKVERSHRNDQEHFYNFLSFYSFEDLKVQMYRYMRRSNRIPMAVLGWISPIERRSQLQA